MRPPAKKESLATTGHELRNVLNAISMSSELLLHEVTTCDHEMPLAANLVTSLQRNVAVMTKLIEDLLDPEDTSLSR